MNLPPVRWLRRDIIVDCIEKVLEEILAEDKYGVGAYPMLPEEIQRRLRYYGINLSIQNLIYYFNRLKKFKVKCTSLGINGTKNGRLWKVERVEEYM